MNSLLCDELIEEIFTRLPHTPSSSLSVSLVCKRWLHLYRSSRSSLSLHFNPRFSSIPALSAFLSHYPSICSLSLLSDPTSTAAAGNALLYRLLLVVSCSCPHIGQLRFLVGPLSVSSLFSISRAFAHLNSLTLSLSRPLFFTWVVALPCLKDLSLIVCSKDGVNHDEFGESKGTWLFQNDELDPESGLESLSLSGVNADDLGVNFLWRSCKRLKKLQLKSCQSIIDGGSFSVCLNSLQEVELRKCRTIVGSVLLKLAENSSNLNSLLVYDGGSREDLLEFMANCRCSLQRLDLRLPLDLNNGHLSAAALKFRALSSLRLQSCCLVTGEGLKTLGTNLSSVIEELALVNCDVVEREPGLLATLGQHLRVLKKLDLSHNEMLFDKELVSMLASCNNLVELKLRGCRGLSGLVLVSMLRSCGQLESVDMIDCRCVEAPDVELFVMNSTLLRQIWVEEHKLSDAARTWASRKFIEVIAC